MRIAAYMWGGQRQVGLVSADGTTITPLALPRQQAERGVLSIIEIQNEGGAMPEAGGASLQISAVQLDAPETCSSQILFNELGAKEIGFKKIGFIEVRGDELYPAQVRALKVSFLQVGPLHHCFA